MPHTPDKITSMRSFVDRFKGRMLDIAMRDESEVVQDLMLQVCQVLYTNSMLSRAELMHLSLYIFHVGQRSREPVIQLCVHLIQENDHGAPTSGTSAELSRILHWVFDAATICTKHDIQVDAIKMNHFVSQVVNHFVVLSDIPSLLAFTLQELEPGRLLAALQITLGVIQEQLSKKVPKAHA